MEFEKDKSVTEQERVLGEAEHVTLQPTHSDIRPELANSPKLDRPDKRNFEFETESTADAALSTFTKTIHPHHHLALLLALVIVVLFAAVIALVYYLR